jgi:hypothetical protein
VADVVDHLGLRSIGRAANGFGPGLVKREQGENRLLNLGPIE